MCRHNFTCSPMVRLLMVQGYAGASAQEPGELCGSLPGAQPAPPRHGTAAGE